MDIETIKHAKKYIHKLANGINPITDELIKDNEIINNIRISRCLFYVSDILEEIISTK